MGWYFNSKLFRFGVDSSRGTIEGHPAIIEIDHFLLGEQQKTYFKKDAKFVEIQQQNYVVSNVIGSSGKSLSNAKFSDENERSELLEKINNPNKDQTKEEFLKEFATFLLSAGWTVIYKKWESFGNFKTLQLINLNPDETSIDDDFVYTVLDDRELKVSKLDVLFFVDSVKHCGKGYSRLMPMRTQIKNINLAQLAKGIQIENSGTTIVSPKAAIQKNNIDQGLDAPVPTVHKGTKTQKEEMENRLNHRGMRNRIIVSNKGLDAVNLSEKLNSVKFFDIVQEDILAIYDAYGFPIEMSPYGKNATYENKPAAETKFIEEEIYPIANNLINTLNSEFEGYGRLEVSFDHLMAVADTKAKIHDTNSKIIDNYLILMQNGIITEAEYRELMVKNKVL